jgi:hypothetical protein
VRLELAADRPLALVAVRLCDVAPDGASLLVSWGLLNLTHREGHEDPKPLEPGRRYAVTVRLNAAGHRLAAGHKWRVAVSPTYWPHAWPSPQPVTLSVFTGEASRLDLPVRRPRPGDDNLPAFAEPETAAPQALRYLRAGRRERTVSRDLTRRDGRLVQTDLEDQGCVRFPGHGLEYGETSLDVYEIVEGDPLSACLRSNRTVTLARGGWDIRLETTGVMTADAQNFRLTHTLEAYEGNTRVFSKTSTSVIPRDLV